MIPSGAESKMRSNRRRASAASVHGPNNAPAASAQGEVAVLQSPDATVTLSETDAGAALRAMQQKSFRRLWRILSVLDLVLLL